MANISLEKSIRTCKVDTGWANKMESDRFLNSNLMLCAPWNGVDTAGRPACWDSYYTKTPGCNSASDRVMVENALRPQYIEYVNLDAAGIRGGLDCGVNKANTDTACHSANMNAVSKITGQYGLNTGYSQNIFPNCQTCRDMPDARAYGSQVMRNQQFQNNGYNSFQNAKGGF